MIWTEEQIETIKKSIKDCEIAARRNEASKKDLDEKVQRLKVLCGSTGGNASGVIDDADRIVGKYIRERQLEY